jgi:hypothetical protein
MTLTRLVDRQELVEKLTKAWLDGYNRKLRREGKFPR